MSRSAGGLGGTRERRQPMQHITLSDAALEFIAARGGVLTISEQVYLVG